MNFIIMIFISRVRRLAGARPPWGAEGEVPKMVGARKVTLAFCSLLRPLPGPPARMNGDALHGLSGWLPVAEMASYGDAQRNLSTGARALPGGHRD